MGDTAKQFSLQNFRPEGFEYPIGLSTFDAIGSGNAATNTTGGTQTIDGTNAVHTFTSSGFFEPSFTGDVEYLIVAGGGGGGIGPGGSPPNNGGGGGGAGGLLFASGHPVLTSSNVTIEIGAGASSGANGTNSTAFSVVALGGGAGGGFQQVGFSGGSGGGAGRDKTTNAGLGTPGQGTNGGVAIAGSCASAGGGGGAGQAGFNGGPDCGNARTGNQSRGGDGLYYSISGANTAYAGGGGGAWEGPSPTPAPGGDGGGGNGSVYTGGPDATPGTVNRGGGGGGSKGPVNNTSAGGSGIVIVRYQTTQNILISTYSIN